MLLVTIKCYRKTVKMKKKIINIMIYKINIIDINIFIDICVLLV